jgi:hypothetical protein
MADGPLGPIAWEQLASSRVFDDGLVASLEMGM